MDRYDKEGILTQLRTSRMGRNLEFWEETGSTNTRALELAAQGAPEGTLVAADVQTSGRGRRGRDWNSPGGSGIWMSLLLWPQISPEKIPQITLTVALAVRDALSVQVPGCGIKWPNDIIYGGRKACGILTQMQAEERGLAVVVGIGVNVNTRAFPEDLRGIAVSLYQLTGKEFSRSAIAADILYYFEKYYEKFQRAGSFEPLAATYNDSLVNIGRAVRVALPDESFEGRAEGIDGDGRLLVSGEDGSVRAVLSGEVSVRGEGGYI